MGYLVWLSGPTFDEMPTIGDARAVPDWRWCVFYPLGSAINRNVVTPIGKIAIPAALQPFPRMRMGGHRQPWFQSEDGDFDDLGTRTQDRSLPIVQTVTTPSLKNMLVAGWHPSQEW
jgi:hypothetical protein